MNVKGNHPVAEAVAKCLSGFTMCPRDEQERMVNRAAKAAVEAHTRLLEEAIAPSLKRLEQCEIAPAKQEIAYVCKDCDALYWEPVNSCDCHGKTFSPIQVIRKSE